MIFGGIFLLLGIMTFFAESFSPTPLWFAVVNIAIGYLLVRE